MPKAIYPVEFRRRFVQGWASHEGTFDEYCLLFGVSRETGYEWRARYEAHGSAGLEPMSSVPGRRPHETPLAVQEFVIAARKLHPTWGPRTLRPWLAEAYPHVELPAPSTIGEILSRNGLIRPRKRRRNTEPFTKPFAKCTAPNGTWTVDFKGVQTGLIPDAVDWHRQTANGKRQRQRLRQRQRQREGTTAEPASGFFAVGFNPLTAKEPRQRCKRAPRCHGSFANGGHEPNRKGVHAICRLRGFPRAHPRPQAARRQGP
jgi:hypothetical protein